ncbi:hypothetical protein PanWU01x14_063080 [Parasponia andersonii]|uniref:Uncharacterized protein n=1 Tax=Parasponia andersonii TaxID=3476 RepID=A0A2P5DHP3_PARAD|nr:hypothetical protein PanWU01x14_063080 [Parasponia andersonii]
MGTFLGTYRKKKEEIIRRGFIQFRSLLLVTHPFPAEKWKTEQSLIEENSGVSTCDHQRETDRRSGGRKDTALGIVDSTQAEVVVRNMLNKGDNLKVVEFGGPQITLEKWETVSSCADGETNGSRIVENTRNEGIGDTVAGHSRKSNNEDDEPSLILSQGSSITPTLELPHN